MAERNFDTEQAEGHKFILGGYEFRTYGVAPAGAFLQGGRGLPAAVRFLRKVVVPEDRAMLERVLEAEDVTGTLLDHAPELLVVANLVLACDDAGDDEERKDAMNRLRDVVQRATVHEEPSGIRVSAVQFDEVAQWLMEETIGRPTTPPSSSSNGGGRTSNGSKATSSRAARAGKN